MTRSEVIHWSRGSNWAPLSLWKNGQEAFLLVKRVNNIFMRSPSLGYLDTRAYCYSGSSCRGTRFGRVDTGNPIE